MKRSLLPALTLTLLCGLPPISVAHAQREVAPPDAVREAPDEKTLLADQVLLVGQADPHQGPLAAAHAKLGVECKACHTPNQFRFQVNFTDRMNKSPGASLGLSLVAAEEALRSQLKLGEKAGLVVTEVTPDSEAARLGFHVYDLILSVNQTSIKQPGDLDAALQKPEGKSCQVHVLRGGRQRVIVISEETLKRIFTKGMNITFTNAKPAPNQYWIGVSLGELDGAIRSQLDLKEHEGVLATQVLDNSPAKKAGMKVNDILLSLNGERIGKPQDLVERVQSSNGKAFAVEILREGNRQKLKITPEHRPETVTSGGVVPGAGVDQLYQALAVRPGVVIGQQAKGSNDLFKDYAVDGMKGLTGQVIRWNSQATPVDANPRLKEEIDRLSKQVDSLQKSIDRLTKTIEADKK
jgi:hypothetical protein